MKFKKFLAGALTLVISCGAMPTMSYHYCSNSIAAEEENDFNEIKDGDLGYKVYSDHAEVTFSNPFIIGLMQIPSYFNDVPVTKIADFSFVTTKYKTIIISKTVNEIGENAFSLMPNLQSITILNPNCKIYDDEYTIYNDDENKFSGTIYGYENSTAQAYAEKYGYNFKSLDEEKTVSLGDPNGDGAINAVDASIMLSNYARYATSADKPTAEELAAGDVDKNGAVNAVDASNVLSFYAYQSTSNADKNKTLNDYIQNK